MCCEKEERDEQWEWVKGLFAAIKNRVYTHTHYLYATTSSNDIFHCSIEQTFKRITSFSILNQICTAYLYVIVFGALCTFLCVSKCLCICRSVCMLTHIFTHVIFHLYLTHSFHFEHIYIHSRTRILCFIAALANFQKAYLRIIPMHLMNDCCTSVS